VRYDWFARGVRLSTYHLATPGTDKYIFSQLLPIKVYLTLVAVALLTKNRFEWAPQALVIPYNTEYSFLGHIGLYLGSRGFIDYS